MRFEKVFDTTLDVSDPIDFCINAEARTLSALRDAFAGRCFMGSFIVRIVQVLRSSAGNLHATGPVGKGYIHVRFLAEVVEIHRGDVLVGVTIAKRDQVIIGSLEVGALRVGVSIAPARGADLLAVGQKAPVVARAVAHDPMSLQITVLADILTCDQRAPVYRLSGVLGASARQELAPLVLAVRAELEARSAALAERKDRYWFFEQLLFAFRAGAGGADQAVATGGLTWDGPPARGAEADVKHHDILDIAAKAVAGGSTSVAGLWSRSLGLYRSSPLVAVAGRGGAPPGWEPATDGAPRPVFAMLLKSMLDALVAVRELTEVYASKEAVAAHENLWRAMRAAQRAA